MKVRIIIGLLLTVISMTVFAHDPSAEQNDTARIKKIITTWMKKNAIPGVAVEVYKNGSSTSYYFGYADREKKIPVTDKTIFEIGSITKVFTSLLVAEEINAGKMSLKDSIAPYVPDLNVLSEDLNNVTLVNLATHTSGLPYGVADGVKTRAQLPEYFANWKPTSAIGSQWAYSNINIGLLGYALEAETHENMNALYRNKILKPLAMTAIGTQVPKVLEKKYAQGYNVDGVRTSHYDPLLFPATGAMKASGQDMSQFLKAALQLPGTPDKILDAMRVTQTAYVKMGNQQQGMGWVIHPMTLANREDLLNPALHPSRGPLAAEQLPVAEQKFDANTLIDKTGGTNGFRSYIAVNPNSQSGIVILANRFVANNDIEKVGRTILLDGGDEHAEGHSNIH